MTILTPLPVKLPDPPTGLLVIFSPGTFAWIADALNLIYRAQRESAQAQTQRLDAVILALGPLTQGVERLMATVAELQTALDANQAATDAAVTAIQTEIAQLQDAINALSTATPPTQEQIDQLNAGTAKLTAATAALSADDPTP